MLRQKKICPLAFAYCWYIASAYINADPTNERFGAAWVSHDTMAAILGVGPKRAQQIAGQAKKAGLVHVTPVNGSTNLVRLNLAHMLERPFAPPKESSTPSTRADPPQKIPPTHLIYFPPPLPEMSNDSFLETLPNEPLEPSRPSVARDGRSECDSSEAMKALGIWNEFCARIDRASLHKLKPEHETQLRYILFTHGLRGWEIIVEQFEARYRRACILHRTPRPPDIGICLGEAESLRDRSDSPGNYPTIEEDELIW